MQSFLKIKPSSLPPPSPLVHDSRAVEEQSKRRTTERLNSEYTARRNITPGSSPAFPFFPIRARRLAIYSSSPSPPSPLSLRLCHRHSPINFKSPSRRVLLITRNFEIRSHGCAFKFPGKKRTREIVFISPSRSPRTIAIRIPPGLPPPSRSDTKFNYPSFLSVPVASGWCEIMAKKLLEIIEDKENGGNKEEGEGERIVSRGRTAREDYKLVNFRIGLRDTLFGNGRERAGFVAELWDRG